MRWDARFFFFSSCKFITVKQGAISFVNVVVSKEKKASRSTIAMTDTRVPILRLHNGLTNV